jgi:hypothetical protein
MLRAVVLSLGVLASASSASCMSHAEAPAGLSGAHDARMGWAPARFDVREACGAWRKAARGDSDAREHDSFPERAPETSCFVPVRYDGETATPGAIPMGCGYLPGDARAVLASQARRYERIAAGEDVALPVELSCTLSDGTRRAAAANNARTLRAVEADDRSEPYPYATIETFGYGHPSHAGTALDGWTPEDACPRAVDLHRFSVNVDRAARAALAYAGHVAPVVVLSGGAVHSTLVEAFLLDYIATCRIGVPRDRVLLDPCANHTHTNVRNAGRLLHAVGGRTAYIVTDDSFQATYLQEWTLLNAIGGSIDQRALRDWGYLIGSWRQASVGIDAGFWYTPYRFWADTHLRDFTCVP